MTEPVRVRGRRLLLAVVLTVLALVALAVGSELNRDHPTMDGWRIASYGCAVLVLVLGVLATRSLATGVQQAAARHAATAAIPPLRLLILIVGYLLAVLGALTVLRLDLSQFLVGGAVTGVVLGIAAQQSLGNFFAGLVLLLARPYAAGDYVTIFSGSINGPHEGTVTDLGLLYTVVQTADGPLHVPNSVLIAAAVRPTPRPRADGRP